MNNIDRLYGETEIYKAVKVLHMKINENPTVNNENLKRLLNLQEAHSTIKEYFQNRCNNNSH